MSRNARLVLVGVGAFAIAAALDFAAAGVITAVAMSGPDTAPDDCNDIGCALSTDERHSGRGCCTISSPPGSDRLRVGGPYGFALAGRYAIAAHGILDRPSEDVDLFADWHRRADFPAAVDEMIAAYEGEGFAVRVDHRLDTFRSALPRGWIGSG